MGSPAIKIGVLKFRIPPCCLELQSFLQTRFRGTLGRKLTYAPRSEVENERLRHNCDSNSSSFGHGLSVSPFALFQMIAKANIGRYSSIVKRKVWMCESHAESTMDMNKTPQYPQSSRGRDRVNL